VLFKITPCGIDIAYLNNLSMTKNICKAKTATEKKCRRKAGASGYCKQHEKINIKQTKKQKYEEVIETIYKVCNTNGWEAWIESKDPEYQFIVIHVSKYFKNENVDGVLDVAMTKKGVEYSIQKTSFHNYGIDRLLNAISIKLGELQWLENKDDKEKTEQPKSSQTLLKILKNFDKSARQIKRRYNNRVTMEINDEYDVQDLLHTILRAFFDDVRPEEYTPSYAGSNSRVDFLLKKEKIIIEVKFASQKLKEKEIGNQLIIDIKKYQTHPDCKQLYCLVYDTAGNIHNPIGLENDLSGRDNKIEVKVLVVPH
jgi:hypothetical protein